MMTNWTKDNMLNTKHPLQKRRVIHPLAASQYFAYSALPSTSAKKNVDAKKRGTLWQKKNFHKPDSTWLHDLSHAEAVTASDDNGSCALLAKYFSHDIFTLLAEETNIYLIIKFEMNNFIISQKKGVN